VTTKTYALVIALLDDAPMFGTYTVGREYEVTPSVIPTVYDFEITDDEGTVIACWWNSDPDCVFERVEREMVGEVA